MGMLAAMSPTSPTPVKRDEAPVRRRGDACPGALRLHAADDGRLARLRLPAGLLTPRQAEVLATAAERLGDGALDITSRGNVQLRGLAENCGAELAELLHGAGLLPSEEHERVRNVVASPLSGLDGLSLGDVQLWARELDALLCASPAATALSGRFLFALDDGRGDVAGLGADVTLLARPGGTATVRMGTSEYGLSVRAADAPRAALLAAETFLTVAEAGGPGAWRVRELPDGQGLDTAVASRLAGAGITTVTAVTTATAATAATATAANAARRESAETRGTQQPPLGLVPSPDGTVSLSVHAPLGRLSVAQWRMLCAREADGRGGTGSGDGGDRTDSAAPTQEGPALRLTPWRGVIVPGLSPATAHDLLVRLRTAGLITTADSPWHGVGACAGRPGCAKALSDVRADAAAAVRADATASATPGGGPLPVHWSGCARRCGRPQSAHVDVVATGEGVYDISVRGSAPRAHSAPDVLAGAVAAARTTTMTR